jgi:hypothetical protein
MIGSFWQKRTSTVAELNVRLWSQAAGRFVLSRTAAIPQAWSESRQTANGLVPVIAVLSRRKAQV